MSCRIQYYIGKKCSHFLHFRQKVGPNIDFKGVNGARSTAQNHQNSYIYLIKGDSIDIMTDVLRINNRQFDVLHESLGIEKIININ